MGKETGVVTLHGRQYKTVALRVIEFRVDHPDWSIATEIIDRSSDRVVMYAVISDTDGRIIGTRFAEELRGGSSINKTSALENCETSAIGRALAACGYGGTEYASANEVQSAVAQQAQPKPKRQSEPEPEPEPEPAWKSDPMTDAQRNRLQSLATDPRLRDDIRIWLKRNMGTLSKGAANTAILKAKSHVEDRTGKPYVPFEDTDAADREPEEEPPPPNGPPDDFPGLPVDEFDTTPPPKGNARKAAEPARSKLDEILQRAKARGEGEPAEPTGQQRLGGTGAPAADRHGG